MKFKFFSIAVMLCLCIFVNTKASTIQNLQNEFDDKIDLIKQPIDLDKFNKLPLNIREEEILHRVVLQLNTAQLNALRLASKKIFAYLTGWSFNDHKEEYNKGMPHGFDIAVDPKRPNLKWTNMKLGQKSPNGLRRVKNLKSSNQNVKIGNLNEFPSHYLYNRLNYAQCAPGIVSLIPAQWQYIQNMKIVTYDFQNSDFKGQTIAHLMNCLNNSTIRTLSLCHVQINNEDAKTISQALLTNNNLLNLNFVMNKLTCESVEVILKSQKINKKIKINLKLDDSGTFYDFKQFDKK